jgi:mono/diheme cytochrome c family protein
MILSPRHRISLFPWSAALLLASLSLCAAQLRGASPGASDAPSPSSKHGDEIFHQRCVICHNKQPGDTTPFGPPNLYDVFRQQPSTLTPKQAETIITQGKGAMPAFGSILSKSDIRSVIAYLRSKP